VLHLFYELQGVAVAVGFGLETAFVLEVVAPQHQDVVDPQKV
jgi:hypothetical protein